MRYKEWKMWVRSKPWCLKWFIYLVLFRTIIDNFYNLKKISPLLSPLYIVGVLTPIFIFMSFNSRKFPKKGNTKIDKKMFLWGIIVFVNLMLIVIFNLSLGTIGNIIKYFTPVLVFFYLRHFILERKDLLGIFQTFLYSTIFAIVLIPYNYMFNKGAFRELSESRGGGFRFAGGYADIMSYAILIIGSLIIIYYFYLSQNKTKRIWVNLKIKSIAIFFLAVIGLVMIKHTATWAVFLTITGLFVLYLLKSTKAIVPLMILLILFSIYFQGYISNQIDPLIGKEIRVIEGESNIDRSFNGRMWRWKRYFKVWDQMPIYAKIFGVSFSTVNEDMVLIDNQYRKGFDSVITLMVSGGMHNDYIRVLFLSGIVGLFFYLSILLSIYWRKKFFKLEDQFLVIASISAVLLYSVSTNPLLYSTLIYLIFSIFAYVSIPQKNQIFK